MVGTWLLCGKRWSLCGRYHGCDVDAVWEGMESVWTLSWFYRDALGRDLHYGGAFAQRARRVCGLSGSVTRQTRGCLHVVFCGATSGPRAKP